MKHKECVTNVFIETVGYQHNLNMVKAETDRPKVHMKTAYFSTL